MLSSEEVAALRRSLEIWARGAELSYQRIVANREDQLVQQADARFLALSVRNVLRAARLAGNHAEGQSMTAIRDAIDAFDLAVPNATEVRDIIEHFDEYERGKGRLQREGTMVNPLQYTVRFEDEYLLALADTHTLDARSASEATSQLAEAVMQAIVGMK